MILSPILGWCYTSNPRNTAVPAGTPPTPASEPTPAVAEPYINIANAITSLQSLHHGVQTKMQGKGDFNKTLRLYPRQVLMSIQVS